jgi:hypothetical protein
LTRSFAGITVDLWRAAVVDDRTSSGVNGWLILAAVLAVLAVVVIVLAFMGIGGDGTDSTSY